MAGLIGAATVQDDGSDERAEGLDRKDTWAATWDFWRNVL